MFKFIRNLTVLAVFSTACLPASVVVNWADWTSGTAGTNGSADGSFQFGSNTVNVTYTGEIAFLITDVGTNYWTEPNPSSLPYTGGEVSNAPPASDLIAMSRASRRTLTFSESVTNLYFAYMSINGNGFVFDQDFELISQGQGYWGNGTVIKQVLGPNQYALTGTGGEPHGVIKFTGTFNSISWTSDVDEYWYGFQVGAAARTADLVPEPSAFLLTAPALLAAVVFARRRSGSR
jgi:hypothetical protein